MPQFTRQALSWLSIVFKERFGHNFILDQGTLGLMLSLDGDSKSYILFPKLESAFHESSSNFPCSQWDADKEGWRSILGELLPVPSVEHVPQPLIEQQGDNHVIHYDILGLTYWMLTRLEEVGRTDLDEHQRFPAVNSHAYNYNYLERPIVDEWLHILGQVIQKQWPQVTLKQHQFSMKVSHDVDSPSLYQFKSWKAIVRMMAGHLLKRRDIKAFFSAPYIKLTAGKQLHKQDPYNTFDWLMKVSEDNNLTSAFYFICGRTSNMDADYEPEHPVIRKLMRQIHNRGHEIGLHPSYGTYESPHLIKQEADRLRKVMQEEEVQQTQFGGRMHYLRWQHPKTQQAWDDASMAYDTTLSYADRPGFRCGTCFEYPAFNTVTQEMMKLRVRPLIVMECTIIAERYINLGYSKEAEDKFLELKEKCRRVGGCFTLLWHNSHFLNRADCGMYEVIINA